MSDRFFRLLLILLMSAFSACSGSHPGTRDNALLPQLRAVVSDSVPATMTTLQQQGTVMLTAAGTHSIRINDSQRDAVLTADGLVWQVQLPATRATHLELAVASVGEPDTTNEAVVTLIRGQRRTTLLETVVGQATGWHQHRIAFGNDDAAGATLELASSGSQPVAWAELFLTGGSAPAQPNLVLILIDTLRADHVSCYGYHRPTTPNLDRLAAEGHRFTSCLAASTWTLPSTATLLTGQMPGQHRLVSIEDRLGDDVTTVAERLRAAGYRTAAFTDGGFLRWDWGFAQGFDRYDCTPGAAWEVKDVAVVADAAIEWLHNNRVEPFFLLLHTYEPHQPYTHRPGFTKRFLGPGDQVDEGTSIVAWELMRNRNDQALARRVLALYDGEVARADHHMGRVLQALRDSGRFDTTAILVTSDHGEEFLEHGGVEHGAGKVFDENVQVPLIIKPLHNAAPAVHTTPVSGRHVTATLLDLAGLDQPHDVPGSSLLALPEAADEVLLVEGCNSFPHLNEIRYRLDRAASSLIYDAVRHTLGSYDRQADPEMKRPATTGIPTALATRLQLILAAESPQGRLLVRLPEGTEQLRRPQGSTVVLRGLWEGLTWRPLAGAGPHPVAHQWPCVLLFDLDPNLGAPLVELGTGADELRLVTLHLPENAPPADWVLLSTLLEPLAAMPVVRPPATTSKELSEQERAELEALGYLQ